ncbi:cholesteryl ester transfer protein [Rhincodon typus]|uniref:cholesteryl ester transfer protein n=1 Tax=Rhincodon typus TaxID=259920 RepID=UPI00202DC57E|nr:cholesteryl ester transfer protein [Rhincodon typus]
MFLRIQLTPVFVFLATVSISCVQGSPPSSVPNAGIVCRFTEEAGLVFNQETNDVIQATFRHASFPDIEGETSILLLGSVSYSFKNLQINNMSVEKSDVDLSNEKGILIAIQNVAAAFEGTMDYTYSSWLANWIQKLFTDFVSFTLRHIVKGQICAEIHKMANQLADFTLYQAGLFMQDGEIATSIELTTDPVLTSGYIESWHEGSVSYKNAIVFQKPSGIPVERVETRMFNLWVSEPVVNSLLFAAHHDNRLTLTLSDGDLLKLFDNGGTKTEPNLLQQMIPGIPMDNLMIKLESLRPPSLLFKSVGTILQASVSLQVEVLSSSEDSYTALYLEMASETIVHTSYTDSKIHLRPSSNHWSIKAVRSNPAIALDESKAKRYLEAFFATGGLEKIISYIEFYITALLHKKGLCYFNITNPVMETDEGYVTIATDFGFPRQLLENFLRNLAPMTRP